MPDPRIFWAASPGGGSGGAHFLPFDFDGSNRLAGLASAGRANNWSKRLRNSRPYWSRTWGSPIVET